MRRPSASKLRLRLVAGVVLLSFTGGTTADAVGLHGCPHHDPPIPTAVATTVGHAGDHHATEHTPEHPGGEPTTAPAHGHDDGPCLCLGECADAPGSTGTVRTTVLERFQPTSATIAPPHPRIVTPRIVAFRMLPLSTAPPTS